MSKQSDSYRAAYGRRTQEHPRQCAFFGSTNDFEFLRDQTGARRFWPVEVDDTGRAKADQLTDEIVDQIWAEAVAAFDAGEKWYLKSDDEDLAREVQAQHTMVSDLQGVIQEFLEKDVPVGFYDWTLDQRRAYWSGEYYPGEEEPETEPRDRICVLEVWCELLGGEPKGLTRMLSTEIAQVLRNTPGWRPRQSIRFGDPYGRQRGFARTVPSVLD